MPGDRENHALFDRRDVVRWYATREALQGAEDTILRELAPSLGGASMLDVGVGGGRTTVHFAPRVRRYVGVDYAPSMVEACRRRFAGRDGIDLRVEDARDLPFDDGEFDFVLFSYCGIDYVSHEDRLRILKELRRVLKEGAPLFFSTHNLQRARTLLHGSRCEGVVTRALGAWTRRRLGRVNPPLAELEARDHAVLDDGAYKGALRTYHIRAGAQIDQLAALGFGDARVFSSRSGEQLSADAAAATDEPWLSFASRAV